MLPFLVSPIIIIFSLIIIIALRSHFECNTYETCNYTIKNNKNSSRLRLVFISDFHNKAIMGKSSTLINDILRNLPDYIILGGDFINFSAFNSLRKKVEFDNATAFLENLSNKCKYAKGHNSNDTCKIFFSFGNHELRLKNVKGELNKSYDSLINALKKLSIDILDNNTVELLNGITISGLSLYKGYYNNIFKNSKNFDHIEKTVLDNYFKDLNKDNFNIISFHKPDYANDLIDYGFDLVLSGHNHGGLIRLPIIGSIFSPDFKLFPKFDYGLYEINGKHLLVSNGLGEHFIRIRINNIPKLYVIDIV